MKRRLSSAVILLSTLFILLFCPSYTLAKDFAKSAKGAVNNYIQGYLKEDFEKIILSDLSMIKHIAYTVQNVPKPFQDEEGEKEILKMIEELKKNEQNKLSKGTFLTNTRALLHQTAFGSGMNLFNILYPKMKYEILEVRDLSEAEIMLRAENCKEMAFVRIFYSSPENAPFLDYSNRSKTKNVIVKIYLAVNQEKDYIISHYSPTDYKRELFKTAYEKEYAAKEKEFKKPTKVIYEFEFNQGGKSNIGYKGKVTNTSIIYVETQAPLKEIQFPNKDQKNIWFGNIWSIVGQPVTMNLTREDIVRKVWQIRIGLAGHDYKFYSTDRAEIDKLMRTIESAISPWYDKYEKFSDRKRKPRLRNLISKSTTTLEKTTRQSSEKAQAPEKAEKVLVDKIARYSKGFSGKWVGTYICGQGITGLTLNISTTSSSMGAVFNFYPTQQNPRVKSGSFSMTGRFSEDGSFNLQPKAWIKRPALYGMVGMSGKINNDFTELEGSISFRGCSSFQLDKE